MAKKKDPEIQSTIREAVIRTLLVSDLVGSTRLIEELGDEETAKLFQRHDRLARDLIERYEGLEIDKTDGFLLLFKRPYEAVLYALAYHQALSVLSEVLGIEVSSRVGIHLGEVFLHKNPAVDVARGAKPIEVEGIAPPRRSRRPVALAAAGLALVLAAVLWQTSRPLWDEEAGGTPAVPAEDVLGDGEAAASCRR